MKSVSKRDADGKSPSEHAIWSGSISFGQVAVLVRLHPAVRERRIQFNLLHKRDLVKLKRQMVCSLDGAPVPPEDQARGFELEGGKYVLIDPAELERADPEASRTIEVHEFVPVADIDPVFLERGYFLEPGEGDTSTERREGKSGTVPGNRAGPREGTVPASLAQRGTATTCGSGAA